tara:strand:- start:677 stop:1060 length:384 start_codon:yes stop_codon:yes gene_type:complete
MESIQTINEKRDRNMNTVKPLSKNVQISKFDRKFNSRDYTIRLNKLGRIFCMDFNEFITAAVQPTEDSTVKVDARLKKDSEFMEKYDVDDFVNVSFWDKNYNGDELMVQISVEQAASLRDQLNALDI